MLHSLRAAQNTEIIRAYFGLNDISGSDEFSRYPRHQRELLAAQLKEEEEDEKNSFRCREESIR